MGEEKKADEDLHQASAARRKVLRDADANNSTIPTVSNFFPLERYLEASDKVLQTFENAYQAKRLDEAYVYGMRYCTFCVKGLVNHDYYNTGKFASRKRQTNQRVDAVLTKLENIAELMDQEEIIKEKRRQALLEKQRQEQLRKQQELERRRLAEVERRIAKQQEAFASFQSTSKPQTSGSTGASVEESALAKLQRLSQPIPPPIPVPIPPPSGDGKKRVSFQADDPDGHSFSSSAPSASTSTSMPMPMLPPELKDEESAATPAAAANGAAPPSYQQILASQGSYFGPGSVAPNAPSSSGTQSVVQPPVAPSYDAVMSQKKKTQSVARAKPKKPKRLPIRQFIAQASQKYREYQQRRLIQVSALPTYQGRVSGSTNGCTVISASVVSKHLQTHAGITDTDIKSVIDKDCIPLLRSIRSKLGLGSSSLIIPSDVHDHMVDHKLLYQHKFVGVAGGNICAPDHIQELYNMLEGEPGKTAHLKAGATLFFREHVVSIVKFPTSPTEAVYDLVDSLPTCNGRGSRTRCMSLKALKVLLDWYTSHKFSPNNISHIERTKWDDAMADFDPRVFQAFVWADLPKPAETS